VSTATSQRRCSGGGRALATWLDSWRGVGAVVGGMRRFGYDVELKQFPMAWLVNFRKRGDEQIVGSAWELTGCRSVQRAAWAALNAR
jgi:hypothetical protein